MDLPGTPTEKAVRAGPTTDTRRENRLLKLVAGASVLMMMLLLALAYSNLRAYSEENRALRTSHSIVKQSEALYSILKDAETGCRGFLLSDDPAFLEPYESARSRIDSSLKRLIFLLPDSEVVSTQLAMRMDIDLALRSMQQLITDQRSGHSAVGHPDMRTMRRGKVYMDRLRSLFERTMDRYGNAMQERTEQERSLGVLTPMTILLYALIALAGIAVLFFRTLRTLDHVRATEAKARIAVADRDREVRTREFAERRLKRVLDSSHNGIMSYRSLRDSMGEIEDLECTMVNSAAADLSGKAPEELLGARMSHVFPENKENGLFDLFVQVIETGEASTTEVSIETNGSVHWFEYSAVRLLDGLVVTFADITDERDQQSLVQETQRLSVTGRFARMVAHEVRNPLTNIHLALDQLNEDLAPKGPSGGKMYLEILQRNAERIGNLITQMLHTSRPMDAQLVPGSINATLKDAFDQIRDRCELMAMGCDLDLEEDLPFVPMDREALTIAFTNLCVNAIEAMDQGKGQLSVSSRGTDGKVRVTIADNGKGLSAEDQERIFQPFFSGRKGGMGLGLTEARNILNAHNVLISLESEVGAGTKFMLVFPTVG
ncbi:MAG: CHASE3 domain-containing protein [Flavobacteriales bacterium]|nr:CHASE3 domain-containing protein [Flavobacteriales bacterium]